MSSKYRLMRILSKKGKPEYKCLWASPSVQECFGYRENILKNITNAIHPRELEVWSGKYDNPDEWNVGVSQVEIHSPATFGMGIYGA